MLTHRGLRREDGFTLIELMVVLVLLGIIGSMVTVSLVNGMRVDRQAQSRIEAFEDMQIAVERMSRDIRAASTPLEEADADRIRLQLQRDGACNQYTYWIDGGDLLVRLEEGSTDGCATFPSTANRILVPDIEPGTDAFTYETAEYVEVAGELERVTATDIDDVEFVTISLTRTLVEQPPVVVSTVVGLRNA